MYTSKPYVESSSLDSNGSKRKSHSLHTGNATPWLLIRETYCTRFQHASGTPSKQPKGNAYGPKAIIGSNVGTFPTLPRYTHLD